MEARQQRVINEINRSSRSEQIKTIPIWVKIMKNRITKLAAAAAIILITVLGINLSTRPAWALENTIEALKHVKMVYISGYANYPGSGKESFELWARPSSIDGSFSGDFRLAEGDNHISVSSEERNLTYVYSLYPTGDVVYITEGLNRTGPYPTVNFFEQLKILAENWKEEYRKDELTGRDSVFVTFTGIPLNDAGYWQFEFDLETKLPVRAGVWWDSNYQGQPHYEFDKFTFDEEIPDGFFDFDIPQGAQVINCRILRNLLDENPNYGITVDELSTSDACKEAVTQYWQAIINRDWAKVKSLRPLAVGQEWDELLVQYNENEPVQLVNISGMNHLNDPGTFAEVFYELRLKNGEIKQGILNVEVRHTGRGRLAVIAGSVGPEFNDKR
jgi:hypothetical protein